MIIQEDTVFVSGLPPSADTKEIAEFFGKIGILKVCIFFNQKKIYDIYSTFFLLIQSRGCLKFVTFTYFIPHKRNGKKYPIFFNFSLPDKIM